MGRGGGAAKRRAERQLQTGCENRGMEMRGETVIRRRWGRGSMGRRNDGEAAAERRGGAGCGESVGRWDDGEAGAIRGEGDLGSMGCRDGAVRWRAGGAGCEETVRR
ncbi:hypothetical protein GCM10010412_055910 [Nonomuraea recticatena]|uniref:Uncharacterized protein n=1 Tax=Nonomuraea recticatena TaxID=46178 RepID=A0ABN3SFI3_9ACTN